MPQIREIKKRIKSVESTQKVTHAMELIAATRMRKSQLLALAGRPYKNTLAQILSSVQKSASSKITHDLLKQNDTQNELLLIITSDRGLAGGLNINIFREILRSDLKNTKYIAVGKKGRDFVAKTNGNLIASYGSEEMPTFDLARILSKMAATGYIQNEYSKIRIIYPHFESTIKQIPTWIQLLPIEIELADEKQSMTSEFIFEPKADEILDSILTHHLVTQIYQVLVEAKASEFSAKMVAMKNATDAAEDLVKDLTLTYNQARQEAITKELLDITTAQKAFE